MRSKLHFTLRALVAMVFATCLVMAPMCAARCSAQACLLPSTAPSTCHETADPDGSTGWQAVAHNRCPANEFVLTTTRSNERLASDGASSPTPLALSAIPVSAQSIAVDARQGVPLTCCSDAAAPAAAIPLRL
jgi:hypothetical protein